MTKKNTIKKILDLLMTIGLLFLMAYQVTGEKYHEWIGTGMLVLFILHNVLNYKFYKSILKGKYTLIRLIRTFVNVGVIVSILITGYSGIVMSNHVFTFLNINSGMASARINHLAFSYWSFVLMSIHLGMHWNMMTGMIQKHCISKEWMWWIARVIATLIACYGGVLFYKADVYIYMLKQNPFAFLDYSKASVLVLIENLTTMGTWGYIGYYMQKGLQILTTRNEKETNKTIIKGSICILVALVIFACTVFNVTRTAKDNDFSDDWSNSSGIETEDKISSESGANDDKKPSDEFVLIAGGTFEMGSPDSENWRNNDETQHTVTVSDFYISQYELTQEEYESVMNDNPSNFTGYSLPVENITWMEAVTYCNARSEAENLTPAYSISVNGIAWNRAANGYRLPTEAEWEYACRAGTTTPFNTETSISAEESNYYGHYPYDIEENYFVQSNLTTSPGEYRETTVAVDRFAPNNWGLYNMHGNVSEWVWDFYGTYEQNEATDPIGPDSGLLRVYRGGGWNDFAKNMRSAYRATMEEDMGSFNIGIRLVRNADTIYTDIIGVTEGGIQNKDNNPTGKVLIAYFSWSGNTKGVAEEIQAQTGADIFEITLVHPYSNDYNTVLNQAQHDQNIQARPEIIGHVNNMSEYDTVLIGYPNWWASIPMPIASFLEEYDFKGKTIIPFCSHGGGRFGQSQTAIAKLAPDSNMGEGLSIHYSGGSTMRHDVTEWLQSNGIIE